MLRAAMSLGMLRRNATRLVTLVFAVALTALAASACSVMTEECPPGQTDCGDVCSELTIDPGNCGECGRVCSTAEICVAGACVNDCGNGETPCGSECVLNFNSNDSHCGRCNNPCPKPMRCNFDECG